MMTHSRPRSLRRIALLTTLIFVYGLVSPPALGQTPDQEFHDEAVDHVLTVAHLFKEAGTQNKDWVYTGDPENPAWGIRAVQALPLDPECRKEAVDHAVRTLQDVKGMAEDEAVAMAHDHLSERRGLIRDGEVDLTAYLRHIGECKAFCAPLVDKLIHCHEVAVASHDHEVVFFGLDRHEIDDTQRSTLAELARGLRRDPRLKILLIGRASRIGGVDYNRVLSGERALAVRDALRSDGIPEDRIETLWLGFEPPQISGDTARLYGIEDRYLELGDTGVNQSVMLVAYRRDEEDSGR